MNKTQPIGKIRCEDCGPSKITGPEQISVFYDGEDFNAIILCSFCQRTLYLPISEDTAQKFAKHGVKVFSWLTGEEMMKEKV